MNNLCILTLAQYAHLNKNFELDFDERGYLRTLTSKNNQPLLAYSAQCISKNTALVLATQFINLPWIKQILQLANYDLKLVEITPFAFGYRITLNQIAKCKNTALVVRGGAIHIAINKKGQIFSLSSTLQHGKVLPLEKEAIGKHKALALAIANCKKAILSTTIKLLFTLHKSNLQPTYEITLGSKYPQQNYTYLILANTGEIINEPSKKPCCFIDNKNNSVKARALVTTPNPNIPISDQISKVIINNLPNAHILKDEHFEMFTGIFAKRVKIKSDGTYCYGTREPEFAAVSIFLSLKKQIELYLDLGLKQPEQPMFVVVNDPLVPDNAYFDPQRYEIHIGLGSGVKNGGLTKQIAFDLGVANHEFAHAAVYLQTVNGDLMGKLGAAINEGVADVLGTLVMDYLNKIWHAKELGKPFTAKELKNDSRIIGKYALPPFGIRSQKNNKSIPGDLTGEPHADGLIIGSALADLLAAMAKNDFTLEKQIKLFTQICLMALTLLPCYKVTFGDMLRAMITADKEICAGHNRLLIEKCFASHGIILDTKLKFNNNAIMSTEPTLPV